MLVANNDQSWGVEEIDGERKYTRHVFFTGPNNEVINARLVYDYRECARVEYRGVALTQFRRGSAGCLNTCGGVAWKPPARRHEYGCMYST